MSNLIYYLLFVNVVTFLLLGFDKFKSARNFSRTPEYVFVWLSLLGGAMGCLVGMYVWKHKTRKAKFIILIPLFVLLHLVLGTWLYIRS